jgi:protein-S-isoprenylcysteine O-methyltransferase Ste14
MVQPPTFAYPEALLFWVVFIWSFGLEMRHSSTARRAPPEDTQDSGTLRRITVGLYIALFLAFSISFFPWFLFPFPRAALHAGTLLLLAGFLLRSYAIRTLGRYFTAAVVVVPDQPVVQDGPYRWIRHPGYAGGFLMFLGVGLALGSWLSLLVFALEILLVYSRRIRVEERALLGTMGEAYREYMLRTKRFIPFVY